MTTHAPSTYILLLENVIYSIGKILYTGTVDWEIFVVTIFS